MAYGDVGGPNLDFSNMGCFGLCPHEFTTSDWLHFLATIFTILYILYWIIKIVIRLIRYAIKTYKSKNQNVSEEFSVIQKESEELQEEEKKSFDLKKELAALYWCGVFACLIIAFVSIVFS